MQGSGCDFVVLETGLGGKYDCTNIVDSIISIITNIGYDHMDILGHTLEEITDNKAGIIKKNHDTIMCNQCETVNNIIKQTCISQNNKLHIINKDEIKNYSFDNCYQKIDYKEHKDIYINLKGKMQAENATIALECMDILKEKGYKIEEDAIKKGLKSVIHKARFEQISDNPTIIFDGGHNENAIKNLKYTLKQYYPFNKKVYIISLLKTKDYKTVIKLITEDKNGIYYFTSGNNEERYVSKEILYEEAKKYLEKDIYKENLTDAIKNAKKKYPKDIIMIIGSFYVYKDVIKECC